MSLSLPSTMKVLTSIEDIKEFGKKLPYPIILSTLFQGFICVGCQLTSNDKIYHSVEDIREHEIEHLRRLIHIHPMNSIEIRGLVKIGAG